MKKLYSAKLYKPDYNSDKMKKDISNEYIIPCDRDYFIEIIVEPTLFEGVYKEILTGQKLKTLGEFSHIFVPDFIKKNPVGISIDKLLDQDNNGPYHIRKYLEKYDAKDIEQVLETFINTAIEERQQFINEDKNRTIQDEKLYECIFEEIKNERKR